MEHKPCFRNARKLFARSDRAAFFASLIGERRTLLLYETRSHLRDTLRSLGDTLGALREIVIARNGEPLVKLVPVPKDRKPRVPGRGKGKIWIAPDCFDPMSEEELDLWEKWDH